MSSRVAKKPIMLIDGTEAIIDNRLLTIKGKKGQLQQQIPLAVKVEKIDKTLQISPVDSVELADAVAGSFRALAQNMVTGVTKGFEKKLVLVGIGYRAQAKPKELNLSLGYSHPINYAIPQGIAIETPSQTEILVKGADSQLVGQVAAEIRAFRSPEPYKGKGVRYHDEKIILKEAKKK